MIVKMTTTWGNWTWSLQRNRCTDHARNASDFWYVKEIEAGLGEETFVIAKQISCLWKERIWSKQDWTELTVTKPWLNRVFMIRVKFHPALCLELNYRIISLVCGRMCQQNASLCSLALKRSWGFHLPFLPKSTMLHHWIPNSSTGALLHEVFSHSLRKSHFS